MLKSAMIRARIEPDLKTKAEKLLMRLGINPTEAITLFYHQVLLQRGLPFDVTLPLLENPSALAKASEEDVIAKAKAMPPQERLEAFYQHSLNLSQLKHAS